jgi:leucyl aminopeptidase
MKPSQFERVPVKFKRTPTLTSRAKSDVLVIPLYKGKEKNEYAAVIGKLESIIRHPIRTDDFKGECGETLLLYPAGQKESRFLLLGLGDPDKMSAESIRRAYGSVAGSIKKINASHANIIFPQVEFLSRKDILKGMVEGVLLAYYRFDEYVTHKENSDKLKEISLIGIESDDMKYVDHVRNVVRGVYLARDLVNRNADEVNPRYLADAARALSEQYQSVNTTVFDKKRLEGEKLDLILAVGRGASIDPALIVCEYKGNPDSKEVTAVVGKGVTYDTGGLNLKKDMLTMKCDMGGAGACLGLILAAASTRLKQNIIVVIPAAENSIDSKSYKPGDVYTSHSGKTVEIGNTDAEGRLILADALSYVCKSIKPSQVIDLATLTGAMVIALGSEYTGMMSNDDRLSDALIKAGEEVHERALRFPLIEEYRKKLKSDIADLKNVSGREAGSIKAALFLQEFITDVPWAHFDIAGTAFLSEAGEYLPKYATGFGVRLLMQFFENKEASCR